VSRDFHALAGDGFIEIIKHDHVRIVDVDGLSMEVGNPELFGSELRFLIRSMSPRMILRSNPLVFGSVVGTSDLMIIEGVG